MKSVSPFLVFSPFLVIYLTLVLLFPSTASIGDESRYIIYSQYMIHGSIPASEIGFDTLGNGPGYSIFLLPIVYFGMPVIFITIVNAILYYLTLIILYSLLTIYVTKNLALLLSFFWGFYLNMYEIIISTIPETLTCFLICLFAYTLIRPFQLSRNKFKWINNYLIPGLILGFLALTKPIFGYVIITLVIFTTLYFVFTRKKEIIKFLTIVFIAFFFTSPYLVYTYHKSHQLFYWSSLGGNNLYWMSTPYDSEYGDWFTDPVAQDTTPIVSGYQYDEQKLILNHKKDYEILDKYAGVEKDKKYKEIALENIYNHPQKFLLNCFSNIGRMLFNFPYSYTPQQPQTLLRIPMTAFLLSMFCITIIPALQNWKKIFYPIRFLIIFTFVYLGGSIFGSAEIRMFTMIVPIFIFWTGYIINKSIIFKTKWK